MDININDLPMVIYVCFVLYNFCELNKEAIHKEEVQYHMTRIFSPLQQQASPCPEAEGKRVRNVLAMYFDPYICWFEVLLIITIMLIPMSRYTYM